MARRKSAIEQALEYSQRSTTYAFEDTGDRCYRDIIEVFDRCNWKRIPGKRRPKLAEKKKLPGKDVPFMVWMLNENDIDFSDLSRDQLCNHFEGIHHLTTKQGICEFSKEGHLIEADLSSVTPRSYNLGDPNHRDEFIDDFRITAAINLLKAHISCLLGRIFYPDSLNSSLFSVSRDTLRLAYRACRNHVAMKADGAWPQVDDIDVLSDKYLMSDDHWHVMCEAGYELGQHLTAIPYNLLQPFLTGSLHMIPFPGIPYSDKKRISAMLYRCFSPYDYQLTAILTRLSQLSRQFFVDGLLNMWVIKSPDSSCGVGIRIFHKLKDILDCERGMGARTVQKYIETPLLSNPSMSDNINAASSYKFDLRVWVAVTSLDPLKAFVYSTPYGRRCAVPFSLHPSTFSNDLCHLTNYSLQKTNQAQVQTPRNSNNVNYSDNDKGGGESTIIVSEADITPSSSNKRRESISSSSQQQSMVTKMRSTITNSNNKSIISNSSNHNISSSSRSRRGSLSVNNSYQSSNSQQALSSSSAAATALSSDHQQQQSDHEQQQPQLLLDHDQLLMNHDEILQCLPDESMWTNSIWPMIKSHISSMLALTAMKAVHRLNSFQLLGVDILLDHHNSLNDCHPWLLEVNMSPAMAHRNDSQSRLIQQMSRQFVQLAIAPKLSSLDQRQRLNEAIISSIAEDSHNPNNNCQGRWEEISFISNKSEKDDETSRWSALNDPLYPHYNPPSTTNIQTQQLPPPSQVGFTVINSNNTIDGTITENGFNISFALVGRSISKQAISHIDYLHYSHAMIVRLQTRLRLFLYHCRCYHNNRHKAAIILQSAIRCRQARQLLYHLRIHRSALIIQRFGVCIVLVRRKQRLLSSYTQTIARVKERCLLRKLCRWRLCYLTNKQRIISSFILYHSRRWLWRYLRRLLKYRRLFLSKRRRYRLIIYHSLRLYYLKRRHARQRVFVFISHWLSLRRENDRKRKLLVASLVQEAKKKAARLLQEEKLERDNRIREGQEMTKMDEESQLLSYYREQQREEVKAQEVLVGESQKEEIYVINLDDVLYGTDPFPFLLSSTMYADNDNNNSTIITLPLPLPVVPSGSSSANMKDSKDKDKAKELEYSLLDFVQHAEEQQQLQQQVQQVQHLSSSVLPLVFPPSPSPSRDIRPYYDHDHQPSSTGAAVIIEEKRKKQKQKISKQQLFYDLQSRDGQLQLLKEEKESNSAYMNSIVAAHSSHMAEQWLMNKPRPLQPITNSNPVRDSLENLRQERRRQNVSLGRSSQRYSNPNSHSQQQHREDEHTVILAAYLDSIHLINTYTNLTTASSHTNLLPPHPTQQTAKVATGKMVIGSRPRPRPRSSSSYYNSWNSHGNSNSSGDGRASLIDNIYDNNNDIIDQRESGRQQQQQQQQQHQQQQFHNDDIIVSDVDGNSFSSYHHYQCDQLQHQLNKPFFSEFRDNGLDTSDRDFRMQYRPSTANIISSTRPAAVVTGAAERMFDRHHYHPHHRLGLQGGADDFFSQAFFAAAESPLNFHRHHHDDHHNCAKTELEMEAFLSNHTSRKKNCNSKKKITRPKSANGAVKASKSRIATVRGYH